MLRNNLFVYLFCPSLHVFFCVHILLFSGLSCHLIVFVFLDLLLVVQMFPEVFRSRAEPAGAYTRVSGILTQK